MTQTRLQSFVEALINTAIGFVIALASQLVIFPLFGVHVSLSSHIWITIWFTGISVLRSYLLRRYFNARLSRALKEFLQ